MKNQKNQNQTLKVEQPKQNHLQLCIEQYVITGNTEQVEKVARACVKKVCLKYAPISKQAMQLYIDNLNPKTQNQDIKDLRQVAILSILQDLHNIKANGTSEQINYDTIFKNCFRALHKYLYSLRGIDISTRPFDYYIEQLQNDGLDILVNIRKGINQLVKDSTILNPIEYEQDEQDEQAQATKKQLVINILKQLTPTQKTICKLLAYGFSQNQIANKLNRTKSTISEHIKHIRNKATQVANKGV